MASQSEWYAGYLASPHWLALREEKLKSEDHQCQRCGRFGRRRRGQIVGLHVHHLTYERVPGNELLDDLEVLCVSCHAAEHGRKVSPLERSRALFIVGVVEYIPDDIEIELEVQAWDDLADAVGL